MNLPARSSRTPLLLLLVLWPASAGAAAAPDSLPPPAVRTWQAGLLRSDRLEHASLAFTLGLGLGLLSRRPATAAAGALGIGFAKEVRDRRHGGFDPVDLAADALGAGAAAFATRSLTR